MTCGTLENVIQLTFKGQKKQSLGEQQTEPIFHSRVSYPCPALSVTRQTFSKYNSLHKSINLKPSRKARLAYTPLEQNMHKQFKELLYIQNFEIYHVPSIYTDNVCREMTDLHC